jgi:acyl-CoA thioester hydrolase
LKNKTPKSTLKTEPVTKPGAQPQAFLQPFSWPVRVYYEDTDAGGVVFYANYLSFMERARTEWLRTLGYEQPEMAAKDGVLFVVHTVNIKYLKPSRFNDSLQVTVEVVNVGGSRIRFLQQVLRGDEEIARAEIGVVSVDTDAFRPARMPDELRATIEKRQNEKMERNTGMKN